MYKINLVKTMFKYNPFQLSRVIAIRRDTNHGGGDNKSRKYDTFK